MLWGTYSRTANIALTDNPKLPLYSPTPHYTTNVSPDSSYLSLEVLDAPHYPRPWSISNWSRLGSDQGEGL